MFLCFCWLLYIQVLIPGCLGRFLQDCQPTVFWLRSSMQRVCRFDVISLDTPQTSQAYSRAYKTPKYCHYSLMPHFCSDWQKVQPIISPLIFLLHTLTLFSFLLCPTRACVDRTGLLQRLKVSLDSAANTNIDVQIPATYTSSLSFSPVLICLFRSVETWIRWTKKAKNELWKQFLARMWLAQQDCTSNGGVDSLSLKFKKRSQTLIKQLWRNAEQLLKKVCFSLIAWSEGKKAF